MPRKSLAQEKADLKKRLSEIEQAEKAQARERLFVIGEAVEAEAKADIEFATRLQSILDQRVKGKKKRELLGMSVPVSSAPKKSERAS